MALGFGPGSWTWVLDLGPGSRIGGRFLDLGPSRTARCQALAWTWVSDLGPGPGSFAHIRIQSSGVDLGLGPGSWTWVLDLEPSRIKVDNFKCSYKFCDENGD